MRYEPERPLAYIDARDLATFLLDAAAAGLGGPCNVVSPRGHETLLEACRASAGAADARLVWTDPR